MVGTVGDAKIIGLSPRSLASKKEPRSPERVLRNAAGAHSQMGEDVAPGCGSERREMVMGKVKCIMFTLEKQILSLSQKGHWHFLTGQPGTVSKV